MATREYICAKDTFTSKGEEKSRFNRVGEIVTIDGSNGQFKRVRLYQNPGVEYHVFEDDRGDNAKQGPGQQRGPQQNPRQPQYQGPPPGQPGVQGGYPPQGGGVYPPPPVQ